MCDLGLTLGLLSGVASGVASAVGAQETADANAKIIQQQAQLEYAAQEREFVVEKNAANKEGYQASLEADRAGGLVAATGNGMVGNTAGARIAEQQRQGALSIANAKDRADAAGANYVAAGKSTQIGAQNRINIEQPSPAAAFFNIATSGFNGAISNYGAFK